MTLETHRVRHENKLALINQREIAVDSSPFLALLNMCSQTDVI